MLTLKQRQEIVTQQFDACKSQAVALEKQLKSLGAQMTQLQGQHKILAEMIEEERVLAEINTDAGTNPEGPKTSSKKESPKDAPNS